MMLDPAIIAAARRSEPSSAMPLHATLNSGPCPTALEKLSSLLATALALGAISEEDAAAVWRDAQEAERERF